MYDLNDYELLYQINNNDEFAYQLMIKKYSILILSKIKIFGFAEKDECFQEGLVVLGKAIATYDASYNKTFTRYFEKLLVNRFINLKKKIRNEYRFDEEMFCQDDYTLEEVVYEYETKAICAVLGEKEKSIYNDYYINHTSVNYIANKYHMAVNDVYYCLRSIKKKVQNRGK